MKLDGCDLDIKGVVMRPLIKTEPEKEWVEAEKAGIIPPALYRFYSTAAYFSFRSSPVFLSDPDRMLFPYIGTLTRGIFESLGEADELIQEIRTAHENTYTPVKKAKGRAWDPKAGERTLRSFKHLVVTLIGTLDQFSEVVAVFFYGEIPNLTPGRASFEEIRRFLATPLDKEKTIVSPRLALVEKLHSRLSLEIVKEGPEKEWLELLLLYRNKFAHLGNAMFLKMAFPTKEGDFFTFLPNRWPLIFEKDVTTPGERSEGSIRGFAEDNLVHQDMVEYSQGLLIQLKQVLDNGFEVLCEAYQAFKEFDVNPGIVGSIKKQSKAYEFRYFERTS